MKKFPQYNPHCMTEPLLFPLICPLSVFFSYIYLLSMWTTFVRLLEQISWNSTISSKSFTWIIFLWAAYIHVFLSDRRPNQYKSVVFLSCQYSLVQGSLWSGLYFKHGLGWGMETPEVRWHHNETLVSREKTHPDSLGAVTLLALSFPYQMRWLWLVVNNQFECANCVTGVLVSLIVLWSNHDIQYKRTL